MLNNNSSITLMNRKIHYNVHLERDNCLFDPWLKDTIGLIESVDTLLNPPIKPT